MNRVQRAQAHADLDRQARQAGFQSAAEREVLTRLHAKLGQGERVSNSDIESLRPFYPRMQVEMLHQYARGVNAGATARQRQDRLTEVWAMSVGVPEHRIAEVCEQARSESYALAKQEYTDPLTRQLNERDAVRDKHAGIDQAKRAEEARHAAMMNPDAQRRADIERATAQHEGRQPVLYARDRSELTAQALDRNNQRIHEEMLRDADRSRLPDRADDRRDTIGRIYDGALLEDMAREELTLRESGLEQVDDALTHEESMQRE